MLNCLPAWFVHEYNIFRETRECLIKIIFNYNHDVSGTILDKITTCHGRDMGIRNIRKEYEDENNNKTET